jgi:quercetin dioxygenase-like cupin family protein
MSSESSVRLRPHPEKRFAADQHKIDLPAVVQQLRQEPQAGERGHRQQSLYRAHGMTTALFTFERFTGLPEHKVNGVVNIHVLRGKLKVKAGEENYELSDGHLLILAPNVPHTVAAEQESEMLLTVHLLPA